MIEDDIVAILGPWLRRLIERQKDPRTGRELTPRGARSRADQSGPMWVVVESVPSAALGAMYTDLLHQNGIPVQAREWGAGSGAFGGVPVGVRLLVPAEQLAAAREILGVDEAGEQVGEERVDEG